MVLERGSGLAYLGRGSLLDSPPRKNEAPCKISYLLRSTFQPAARDAVQSRPPAMANAAPALAPTLAVTLPVSGSIR
jgi:hypothetical protein